MAKSRVIGLDIGTAHVAAVEIEFGSGGPAGKTRPTLLRYGSVPLPLGAVRDGEVVDADVVAGALRELWSTAKFGSRDVVIGVGNQRVVVRELELPWMALPQIRASLAFQVEDLLPMPVSEALMDYYPTGEYEGAQGRMVRGMLVAAARDTVNANILAVEAAGLRPVMVDLNAFALARALHRGELAGRTGAVVDVGAKVTNVIISHQGMPRFIRTVAMGGQDVTDAVAGALGVSATDAERVKREIGVGYAVAPEAQPAADAILGVVRTLIETIRNTFAFYTGNNPDTPLEMVVLTGGGGHLPGFGQYLASSTRLPVSYGNAVASLRMGKAVEGIAGAETLVTLPIGLAHGVAA